MKTGKQINSIANQQYPPYIEYKPNPNNFNRMQAIDVNEEKRNAFIEGFNYCQNLQKQKHEKNS